MDGAFNAGVFVFGLFIMADLLLDKGGEVEMTHTFQQGDRVIVGDLSNGAYQVSRCGEYGVLKLSYGYGHEVILDKQELNRSEGFWYVSDGDLRHDTDFRKGDWVRLEPPDKEHFLPSSINDIYQFIGVNVSGVAIIGKGSEEQLNIASSYLVKIQSPKE